jgi:hypothetical protein
MSQPHAVIPPVVSLQARDAEDPDRGHLATGLLVDRSVVFVPSPPAQLLDLAGSFEVLIFPPAPRAGDPLIERIPPAGLTVPYTGGSQQPPLGATIRLSRPSRNPLSIQREPGRPAITGRALAEKLADGRDLWTALAELRAISPTLRRPPSKAVWNRLREAEGEADPEAALEAEGPDEGEGRPQGRRVGAGTRRPRTRSTGRHPNAAPGVHQPESLQALGFSACWLVPWWCRNDD